MYSWYNSNTARVSRSFTAWTMVLGQCHGVSRCLKEELLWLVRMLRDREGQAKDIRSLCPVSFFPLIDDEK